MKCLAVITTVPLPTTLLPVRAMITEKELNSWNQLQAEIENLVENLGEKTGDLLFRGQADSTWGLDTTVERKLKTPISLNRYYRFAYTAKPRLETFVEVSWDIPTPPEYDSWLNEKDTLSFAPLPGSGPWGRATLRN